LTPQSGSGDFLNSLISLMSGFSDAQRNPIFDALKASFSAAC
jgi:hypothetical protein